MRRRLLAVVAVFAATLPAFAARTTAIASSPYLHLVGGLHAHTGYSDGVPGSRPADAYAAARDLGLDFYAVSDHSETLDVPPTLSEGCLPTEGGGIVECALADADADEAAAKWEAQRRQATLETRAGKFTALRAFEWSSDVHGHVNVYFSRNYTQWLRDGGNATLEGFYRWLQLPAHLGGGDDSLATFNHPGDKTLCDVTGLDDVAGAACAADPAADWNGFRYVPELDERIVGVEIFNRSRSYESSAVRALDNGWHVGIVGAEDYHDRSWGSPSNAKTVMLAGDRTPQSLKDAMRARRTYATRKPGLRLDFRSGDHVMGSRVATDDATVPLTATVAGGSVDRLDLLTSGGRVVASSSSGTLAYTAPVADAEAWYLVRASDGSRAVAYTSPIWVRRGASSASFGARWVAGDLHIHTTWSHDSYGGIHDHNTDEDEAYTAGWAPGEQISIGESRGLDFVALTDHNNTFSVYDPGFTSGRMSLIPAYEASFAGHSQIVNTPTCIGRSGSTPLIDGCNSGAIVSGSSRDDVQAVANGIRAAGGFFQINHPSDGDWADRFGDGNGKDGSLPIVPDSIEIWNIGPWHYQPPAPSSNDNDYSLRFWESYLNKGYRVAATGGSDNHWRSTTAAQGVGQPTTWVYVTKPGIEGIVEGIRAGRTSVSHLPPGMRGQQLFIGADVGGDGNTDAGIGGTVPQGATLQLRATNAPPGALYRVVTDVATTVVERTGEVTTTPIPLGARWVRAELFLPDAQAERQASCDPLVGSRGTYCRNRLILAALTSAIYVLP